MAASSKDTIMDLMQVIRAKQNLEKEVKEQEFQESLDQQADQPSDEQGDAKQLGEKKFVTGKHKSKEFRDVYVGDKSYTEWTRQNVMPSNPKWSLNMLEFRLYVEVRDQFKKIRVGKTKPMKVSETARQPASRRTLSEASWEELMSEGTETTPEDYKTMLMLEIQEIKNTLQNMENEKMGLEKKLAAMMKLMDK